MISAAWIYSVDFRQHGLLPPGTSIPGPEDTSLDVAVLIFIIGMPSVLSFAIFASMYTINTELHRLPDTLQSSQLLLVYTATTLGLTPVLQVALLLCFTIICSESCHSPHSFKLTNTVSCRSTCVCLSCLPCRGTTLTFHSR